MPIIETHHLSRRFFRTTALRDVNLTIEPGTVNVLIGANGAGKTTLLKLLVNLLPPTSGHASIFGTDSRQFGPTEFTRIGYVSENLKHAEGLTVANLLNTWRPLYPKWDRELEARLLRQFELPTNRKLHQLSRGMLMKASLLSVLPFRPELLILDEPFSGLDPLVRDQVTQGILELVSEEGCTVLVSSHEISEVESLADRLIWLDRGELKLAENADSLRARFRQIEITLPESEEPPSGWNVTRNGPLCRYVSPHFDPATVRPGATVTPMSLREIFVALLRNQAATSSPSIPNNQ